MDTQSENYTKTQDSIMTLCPNASPPIIKTIGKKQLLIGQKVSPKSSHNEYSTFLEKDYLNLITRLSI